MFWLIAMLASVGVGAASVVVTLQRMGGNFASSFKAAPALEEAALVDGAYGRLTGIVGTSRVLEAPGIGAPCVLYELVVYRTYEATYNTASWRVAYREQPGDQLTITVGNTVVHVAARDVYLLTAPAHDATANLGPGSRSAGYHRSRVRYVPDGAVVQIAGTLVREVDDDPAARRDYRETATRLRLVGTRKQPLVLACEAKQARMLAAPATTATTTGK